MKMSMEHWWDDTDRGNWSTGRKACPTATFSTRNIRSGLGSNPDLRGEIVKFI
jgi:hypothetical protein